jgi:PAS domain S-box-containing protein
MFELDKKEMVVRYGAIGFVLGIVFTVVEFALLLYLADTPFSFEAIAQLHQSFPFVYLMDFAAVPVLLGGAFVGNWRYKQLDTLSQRIRQETDKNEEIKKFTQALIEGDLNTELSLTHIEQSLSDTLYKLRDTLNRNREMDRQRRLEERQRNWISEGLAEFGDILRKHSMDMETMTYSVISRLVRYLDANQGAIFLRVEKTDEPELEMVSCFAYERKKFPDKTIAWGDGLIGAAALEKKGYYTDRIQDGYLNITSGLGKANPRYLLIEPLLWNDRVFGVVEIASFKQLDEHKILFVQRVAENIATTINSMNSNLRTEQLLKETRAQADQLLVQEEQARQNMEALQVLQEEGAKQAEIFISFTNTVNHTLMRAEYDTQGILLYANTRFLKKLGYSGNREVEGKHISMFINEKDHTWFNALWETLSQGGKHFEGYMKHETKLGQDLWTMATYTCVRREDGSVEKILFLAIDSTEQKKQSLDYEGQIDAIDRLNAKAIFSPDGRLQTSNSLFSKSFKYADMELEQMNVFDFFATGQQERFNEIWEKVILGEAFQGQLKMQSKFEEALWFRATFLSVNDMYGEVEKVIFLANEITKEKEMELASRKQYEKVIRKEEDLRMDSLDLKRKLEESLARRELEKRKFQKDIKQYMHVLEELPFSVISINNLGFVLFFNKHAERLWKRKAKDTIGERAEGLFQEKNSSEVIRSFIDPARSKASGLFSDQDMALPGQKPQKVSIMLIRTDSDEEVFYTLIIL